MTTHKEYCPNHSTEMELVEKQVNAPEEFLWEVLFSPPPGENTGPEKGIPTKGIKTSASTVQKKKKHRQIPGVVIGMLAGRNETGQPLVEFPGSPEKEWQPARTTVRWTEADVGREVVLMFERGHPCQPIIIGFLQPSQPEPIQAAVPVQANLDGERLVFSAEKEIVLRCGKATLTLTQAGKVLLQGTYLSSRSSGVNRIKGGSVQIN